MANELHRILRLSKGASTGDGSKIKFRVETKDGRAFDFVIEFSELQNFFQYLAYVAEDASKKRTHDKPQPIDVGAHSETSPLPATHLGLIVADTQDTVLLVVRNYDFDLAFHVDAKKLDDLSRDLGQIAATLKAQSDKPH